MRLGSLPAKRDIASTLSQYPSLRFSARKLDFCGPQATHLATLLSGYRLCVLTFSLLLSFAFEVFSPASIFVFDFLKDILATSAASPPVETVPATTSPRVS